jgi:hypothetical protein
LSVGAALACLVAALASMGSRLKWRIFGALAAIALGACASALSPERAHSVALMLHGSIGDLFSVFNAQAAWIMWRTHISMGLLVIIYVASILRQGVRPFVSRAFPKSMLHSE